ncbi:MAG: hypothetical protein H6625_06000 [Bdellovibrionaceae bacterium]|nr:hypothetical protein [Pseudobdellovibrionaceae bacterium]
MLELLLNYSGLLEIANPLPGQTLKEVKVLIDSVLEEFKQGQFTDDLLKGAIFSVKSNIEKTWKIIVDAYK